MKLRVAGKTITTIVSDLDGTLLEPMAQSLRPEVLEHIETLVDGGINFIAASGRQYTNMQKLFGMGHDWDRGLWKKIAYNCENGAVAAWNGEIKREILIPEDVRDLLLKDMEALLEREYLAAGQGASGLQQEEIIGRPGPYYEREPKDPELLISSSKTCFIKPRDMAFYELIANTIGNQTRIVSSFHEMDEAILKMSIHFPGGVPKSVSTYFHEKYDDKLLVFEAGNGWLDFVPIESGKGPALAYMAENMGFSLEETMTFGDSENDISMLQVSGLGICMAAASKPVKEAAVASCADVDQILSQCVIQGTMEVLHDFVNQLAQKTDKPAGYGDALWEDIFHSEGILKELAYFHDTGSFWGQYKVAGYSLTDILVWQVDHFKAYMDRHQDMNRYRRERLFLESVEVMAKMEKNPEVYIRKMQEESGTDSDQKYQI